MTGIVNTGNTNIDIINLVASTPYKFYLRRHCNVTSITTWLLANTFRTKGPIYVNYAATGVNDGSSWADAYTNLRQVLSTSANNEEIWIAAGIYKPDVSDVSVAFEITQDNLKIYGGFLGTEASISDRIIGTNETIFSGDLQSNDNTVLSFNNGSRQDNSTNILKISGDGILLDRVTIKGAHNRNGEGGAVTNISRGKNLTINQCTISNNVAIHGGAGLLFSSFNNGTNATTAFLKISNTLFLRNLSRHASGLYITNRNNADIMNIDINNSLFAENKTDDVSSLLTGLSGSAMWLRNTGSAFSKINANIINCTITNNENLGSNTSTKTTVGINFRRGASRPVNVLLANTIIYNNIGGIYATGAIPVNNEFYPSFSVTVKNCIGDYFLSTATNTLNTDPLFTDAVNGVYTLSTGSPAIDSGDNTSVIGQADLLGNQRIFNTTVDMGAYEFGSTATLGIDDLVNDQAIVNIYPNPTIDKVIVNSSIPFQTIILIDLSGKVITQTSDNTVSLLGLPSGMYILQIKNGSSIITKKVIKN